MTDQNEFKKTSRKRKAAGWNVNMEDDNQLVSDNVDAGRRKLAAKDGYLVPKLESDEESGTEIEKQKLAITGDGSQEQEHISTITKWNMLPADIHEALLDHLMELTSTGFFVTSQQQLVLLVKRFLDKRQVTSSFPDNQPSEEWMQQFLGEYRRRLMAVRRCSKNEIAHRQKMPAPSTNDQAAVGEKTKKTASRWTEWPQESAVNEVLTAPKTDEANGQFNIDNNPLKVVELLDETEEVAFVMKLIRADKHYMTGLLPTLLKNYLDERNIIVRRFRQNWPSAAYMNGFLRRHGKYLAGVIMQPAALNSVTTTKVNVDRMVSSEQKHREFGVQQPLANDEKPAIGSKEEMLQMSYRARLDAALQSHLTGEFPSTYLAAKKFLVNEDDLIEKIAVPKQTTYKSRLNAALDAFVKDTSEHRTIDKAAKRFGVHPEALLTRVHEHNRANVSGNQGKFAITPKMENAFVKTLLAASVVRHCQETALLMAWLDQQGIKVPNNLSLEEWSKTVTLKHEKRLNKLIVD